MLTNICFFNSFLCLIFTDDDNLEGGRFSGMHLDGNQSLFYVEIPGGTTLSHVVEENEKFPAQFGREVIC